jgi:hypothetical protein
MVALNSAMMTDGVVIEIADGTVLRSRCNRPYRAAVRRRAMFTARACGSASGRRDCVES